MEIVADVFGVDFRNGRVWAYLYRDGRSFTLIDAGIPGDIGTVRQALKGAGGDLSDIRQIVLTHHHVDHVGTVAELQRLTGAITLAHTAEADVVRGKTPPAPPILSREEKLAFEELSKGMPPAAPAEVHRELEDGDEIEIGDGARVIHVPGHTAGSIAIHIPSRGLLFAGDIAVSGETLRMGRFNADPEEARRSFVKLAEIDADVACLGHGPPITNDAREALRAAADRL